MAGWEQAWEPSSGHRITGRAESLQGMGEATWHIEPNCNDFGNIVKHVDLKSETIARGSRERDCSSSGETSYSVPSVDCPAGSGASGVASDAGPDVLWASSFQRGRGPAGSAC